MKIRTLKGVLALSHLVCSIENYQKIEAILDEERQRLNYPTAAQEREAMRISLDEQWEIRRCLVAEIG